MASVLLVGIDDVSWSEITPSLCPRISAFRKGAYEVQAFSHPVCSQSRAGILFGSYGKKIGTYHDIGQLEFAEGITPPASLPTLPSVLAAAGFETALVGKWHCGPRTDGAPWQLAPMERGYGSWLAGTRLNLNDDGGTGYSLWTRVDAFEDGSFEVTEGDTEYPTHAQLDAAEAWWDAQTSAQRFLHVAFNAPHGPLHANIPGDLLGDWPPPSPLSSNRQKFLAMLRSADTAFGRLVDMVGSGVSIFLYADNGTSKQSQPPGADHTHSKETTFDAGIRVPVIAKWGNNPSGFFPSLGHLIDIPAGVCAAAGVPPSPAWDAKTTARNYILSEAEISDGTLDRCARTQSYKLRQVTPPGEAMHEELYNLVQDPQEIAPLDLDAPENAEVLGWLRSKLELGSL